MWLSRTRPFCLRFQRVRAFPGEGSLLIVVQPIVQAESNPCRENEKISFEATTR
jgi:hypothetical protein